MNHSLSPAGRDSLEHLYHHRAASLGDQALHMQEPCSYTQRPCSVRAMAKNFAQCRWICAGTYPCRGSSKGLVYHAVIHALGVQDLGMNGRARAGSCRIHVHGMNDAVYLSALGEDRSS